MAKKDSEPSTPNTEIIAVAGTERFDLPKEGCAQAVNAEPKTVVDLGDGTTKITY